VQATPATREEYKMSRDIFPEFTKGAVNRAGANLASESLTPDDVAVIENWRAAHNYVLNTFQASLRIKAKKEGWKAPVQRIKRIETIQNKLIRFPDMQLARMHDIVGCRLIFEDIKSLVKFRLSFNKSRFSHRRRVKKDSDGVQSDAYNYITNPKKSGYRGIHDVFEYRAKQAGAAKKSGGEKWNGLHIEIQYRTTVQHAWATAVEICDKYTDNHGKFSDAPDDYLRYFQISSELLARHFEDMQGCLPGEDTTDLIAEFNRLEAEYGMIRTLRGIQPSQQQFDTSRHTLLIFDETSENVKVITFSDFRKAIAEYFRLEREKIEGTDVVLVAADDPESVRFGFKNYFSDAKEFVAMMDKVCGTLQ
jgi:putative GTP pyrophosphokinase